MDSLDDLFDELLAQPKQADTSVRRDLNLHRSSLTSPSCARKPETQRPQTADSAPNPATSSTLHTKSNTYIDTNATAENPTMDYSGQKAPRYTHSVLKENVNLSKHFFRPNDQSTAAGSRKVAHPPPIVEDNLSRETAELLARVVGTQRLNDAWNQGFFCANYQPYGLQQVAGGPCGVIASVQAFLLKHLFINLRGRPFTDVLHCSAQERTEALINALTDIFWQAGDKRARILIPSAFGHVPLDAKRFNQLCPVAFSSKDQLRQGLSGTYKEHFLAPIGGGVATFLYSLIYSRGLENIIKRDFDEDNSGMIGAHGYCTQELVNLCLFGRAYSNVFDGCKRLGSDKDGYVVMQGVPRKGDVGFLSLFEAFDVHEVGSRLKCPVEPIWIVVAESHYTVLFADPNTYPDTKAIGPCTLFYFDPLARQSDLLRLSIEPDGIASHLTGFEENGSMIERVIRTKWRRAHVDWHGKDAIM